MLLWTSLAHQVRNNNVLPHTALSIVLYYTGGLYNQSDAKLYCMVLKQPTIFTNAMENSTDREKR